MFEKFGLPTDSHWQLEPGGHTITTFSPVTEEMIGGHLEAKFIRHKLIMPEAS